MNSNKTLLSDFALVFVAISWGATFMLVQNAINKIDVFSFLFWRFLISAILMWLISLKFELKFDKKSLIYGGILGIFLFLGFAFQTLALKYTLSSSVAFITGIYVVLVPFLMLAFFKQKVRLFAFLGAFVAFLGLYFLSGASGVSLGLGEILTLVCAFAFAFQIALTGEFVKKANIYALVIAQFVCVCVFSLILAIFLSHGNYENSVSLLGNLIFSFEFDFLFALIITSVFATVLAYFIQTFAQLYTSATKTVLIFALEPVSAGIIGYIFGENLSNLQIFGAGLILFGIILSELGKILFSKPR